jgi:hypothetical protein
VHVCSSYNNNADNTCMHLKHPASKFQASTPSLAQLEVAVNFQIA